ncbi:hypothetical protein IEQ34_007611 [Dendrobium chrysotoxum]|uniref:Uncharacterized protein n=1 Tax=Dendrobium chrysotoxum TaxID=161865 RepID=A0AAV7H4N8_DENCH|nr:hypothetical protein IEQ34_007611 [Dendrobium chrysotoxum]
MPSSSRVRGHLRDQSASRATFPPPPELIDISARAISMTVGLTSLFRDRGAILMPKYLSRMG